MKIRPFNAKPHEVRAILAGRQTQFRRILTTDESTTEIRWVENAETLPKTKGYTGWIKVCGSPLWMPIKCPFGAVGDRLWVRESFRESGSCQRDDGKMPSKHDVELFNGRIIYAIDDPGNGPWRPSIHMPRWASRITLEVVDVRVQRVQEINTTDAVAENADEILNRPIDDALRLAAYARGEWIKGELYAGVLNAYAARFDADNHPGAWDANPFVWAVTFKRVEDEA